jgi:hypothetical protein
MLRLPKHFEPFFISNLLVGPISIQPRTVQVGYRRNLDLQGV